MKQLYHPYWLWEDWKAGQYNTTCIGEESKIEMSFELLSSPVRLYESMLSVSLNWVYSSEHRLSNFNMNRKAWIGQAACCFCHSSPSFVTCQAWNKLSIDTKKRANKVAQEVIVKWERKYFVNSNFVQLNLFENYDSKITWNISI